MKVYVFGIGAALVLTLVVFFLGPDVYRHVAPPKEIKLLSERTIVDYGTAPNGTVSYSYLGSAVPEKITQGEMPELRNETSYTNYVETVVPGSDPTLKLESRIYSQPAFAQDADGTWKYLEYATTTEQAFRSRDMTLGKYLTELIVRSAYADTVSPFSGAGDGYVTDSYTFGTGILADCRIQDPGTSVDSTATAVLVSSLGDTFDTSSCVIERGFLPFDTSSIPSSATISAASLNAYVTSFVNGANDGTDYITVSTSTTATHTTLATSDFAKVTVDLTTGSECIDSGQRKDISSMTLNAYLTFTFNATGLTAIKKSGQASTCSATTGITCLSLREGHDAAGAQPNGISPNRMTISASETTGTSQDPYLSVTYTAVASTITRVKMNGGRIRVQGGRFKLQSN